MFSNYLITVPLKGRSTQQFVTAIEDTLILKVMPPLNIRNDRKDETPLDQPPFVNDTNVLRLTNTDISK